MLHSRSLTEVNSTQQRIETRSHIGIVFGALGEAMVEKAFLVEPHRKAVTLVRHPSIMVVIGVGAFLLFIGETVGTAQNDQLSCRRNAQRPGDGKPWSMADR